MAPSLLYPRHTLQSCALAVTLLLITSCSSAGEVRSHDRARAAVEAGQILPLQTVLQRIAVSHPGQVLEVELEKEGGRWVYEIKLLRPGGSLLKLELDAQTALPLNRKEKP